MRLWARSTYPKQEQPVLYAPATGSTDILELDGWAVQIDTLPTTLLLDVDRERPRPGAPYAVVYERRDVVSNTQDATEWLQRDVTPAGAAEMLRYFRSVPFRSFFSIPLFDVFGREVIGAVSVQVDKPGIFVAGNRETEDLIELVNRFCYFLVWLEAKLKDAQLNAIHDATR